MKFFCSKSFIFRKVFAPLILAAFFLQSSLPLSHAELLPQLPAPGTMVFLTSHFESPTLLGMTINPDNPLLFEFLIDRGQDEVAGDELKNTTDRLVKYFLSALTVPNADAWVNLSPYENNRIMPDHLSVTEMGKTMLEQDYLLKQLAASLTNPEGDLGKKFWSAVQEKMGGQSVKANVPMSTLNKVWIVPQKALVVEKDGFVLIGESRLRVMLQEDYEALKENRADRPVSTLSSTVFREIILPELEKEVNEGKTFAPVRQIYHAVILAKWFKQNVRESLLGQVYVDQNKVSGIDVQEKNIREKVYEQYLQAFQKGAYSLIRDDVDGTTDEAQPRKYFSGGTSFLEVPLEDEVAGQVLSLSAQKAVDGLQDVLARGRVSSATVQLTEGERLADVLREVTAATQPLRGELVQIDNLVGSSSLRDQDGKEDHIILTSMLVLMEGQAREAILPSELAYMIFTIYKLKVSTEKIVGFLSELGAKRSGKFLQGEERWELTDQFVANFYQVAVFIAMKTFLELHSLADAQSFVVNLFVENDTQRDALLAQWRQLNARVVDIKRIDEEALGLKDTALWDAFERSENMRAIIDLLSRRATTHANTIKTMEAYLNQSLPKLREIQVSVRGKKQTVGIDREIFEGTWAIESATAKFIEMLMDSENTSKIKIRKITKIIFDGNLDQFVFNPQTTSIYIPSRDLQLVNKAIEAQVAEFQPLPIGRSSSAIDQETVNSGKKGGIDFDPALFDLQIKRDGRGVALPLRQQNLNTIKIDGLYPVIIDIVPATLQNVPILLKPGT